MPVSEGYLTALQALGNMAGNTSIKNAEENI